MKKNKKINVKGLDVVTYKKGSEDYISLTDIARYRGVSETDDVIKNWMRNRSTIEFLGLWEKLNNIAFKPVEFDGLRAQAGAITYANEADVLNMALFGVTAKEWRDKNHNKDGNIRDDADVSQLVVLANLESMNAELIRQGLTQPNRLKMLNQIAITQIKSLLNNPTMKHLQEGEYGNNDKN